MKLFLRGFGEHNFEKKLSFVNITHDYIVQYGPRTPSKKQLRELKELTRYVHLVGRGRQRLGNGVRAIPVP